MSLPVTVTRYRLRPVPWLLIVTLSACWAGTAAWVAPRLGPAPASIAVQVSGLVLGLAGSFLVSADTDPPAAVLRVAPVGYWRAYAVRLLVWMPAAVIAVGLVGAHVAAREHVPAVPVVAAATASYLLAAGISGLLAMLAGSYLGGCLTLAGLAGLAALARGWHGDPVALMAVPGHAVSSADYRIALAGAALLVLTLRQAAASQQAGGRRPDRALTSRRRTWRSPRTLSR